MPEHYHVELFDLYNTSSAVPRRITIRPASVARIRTLSALRGPAALLNVRLRKEVR